MHIYIRGQYGIQNIYMRDYDKSTWGSPDLWSLFILSVERIADGPALCTLHWSIDKLVVNLFLDKDAWTSAATLALVEEQTEVTLFHRLIDWTAKHTDRQAMIPCNAVNFLPSGVKIQGLKINFKNWLKKLEKVRGLAAHRKINGFLDQKFTAAKQIFAALVASYDTRPGNEVGLFYDAPEPTQGSRETATDDVTIRYDTIEEINVDSKAEYTA